MLSNRYNPGEVVAIEDYGRVYDAWIAPDGRMLHVPPCGHETVARFIFGRSVWEAERAGYAHLSEYDFVGGYDRLTEAQVNTILLYCTACSRPVPDWCFAYNDAPIENKRDYSMSNKYSTTISKRKLRELFYPNNGD